jgi:hypothetical protein
MKLRSISFHLLSVLLGTSFGDAYTTVGIIRTANHIVIGADSKAVEDKTRGAPHFPSTTCKIHESNGIYFASVGLIIDPKFNADLIVATVLKRKGTMEQRVAALAAEASNPFLAAMQRMHKFLPDLYRKEVGSAPFSVGFAGIERGIPRAIILYFSIKNDFRGRPEAVSTTTVQCPGNGCDRLRPGSPFFLVGYYEAAAKATQAKGFFSGDDANDVRRMIQIEIDDQPLAVGPPIDVLFIDGTGGRWIAPLGSCGPPHKIKN